MGQAFSVGDRVLAYRFADGLRHPAAVVALRGHNGGKGKRSDVVIRYDDDQATYSVWSASLIHDLNAPRKADDIAPAWHEARECFCCGESARTGSVYCSERCRVIVEGNAETDTEYRTLRQAEQAARWGILDAPTPLDLGVLAR
ncbi:MAG: hypothetical protein A3E78_04015 [Alphaproteobacteria bacterium RIFCSPHIGHO2_12_FULL_63_12]|nr:MAG: hypothetical protein A3E78_04015 [Alphaproteobacteria bacterium RIFCSPHIGHO2_12_FULL_63_12]